MMNTTHSPARRHDLDALRAAAMLLGIAYHAALSFALGFPWMVQDSHQNRGFYLFQAAVHGFRMPLFFLISGFFTAMVWRRRGLKSLLWQRFRRVLIPCLLGLFTVVPAMQWAGGVASNATALKRREAALAEPASASLWAAVRKDDAHALQQHLNGGTNLDALHPEFGTTLLTWAALTGQSEIVNALLDRGADANGRNRDGGTALHAAAFLGRSEIVERLIQNGADINARNHNGETPLHSAGVDLGVVDYIAGLLALEVERKQVELGRERIVDQLRSLGADEGTGPVAGPDATFAKRLTDTFNWLIYNPVFIVIWFLWFLWWFVIAFAVYAGVAHWLGWKPRPQKLVLSPAGLLLLLPLTMAPLWFMGSSQWDFGPDTSMGIVPMPHVFAYYALFFAFGVLYYDSDDVAGRLGNSWRWTLPVSLLVVLPLGLEFAQGTFGLRDALLPARFHRPATVALQALYAWMMSFGCMGMSRSLLTRENRAIRYMSDASYWLYLAHLPLVIVAQSQVRDWPLPATVKMALVTVVVTTFLLLVYDTVVRYTWIGTLLNGRRVRPPKQERLSVALEGSTT